MGTVTKDFDLDDFRCHCAACAGNPSRPATKLHVISAVQSLRDYMNRPLRITCGVRCPEHNDAVGGTTFSRHLPAYADAVDIATSGPFEADEVMAAIYALRIFVAKEVCKAHIHVDMRPTRPMCFPGEGP